MTILAAFRDIGSTRMIAPLVPLLEAQGILIRTYLEGQARIVYPELTQRSASLALSDDEKNTLGEEQWKSRIHELAQGVDAIIVGNSTPAGGEVYVAQLAREQNIPLIVMDDIGGGWKRIPDSSPALIVTTIAPAVDRAQKEFPSAVAVAAGIPALPSEPIAVPDKLTEILHTLRTSHGRVVLFSLFTGGSVTAMEEQVKCVADCLRLSPRTALLASVHPKSRTIITDNGMSFEMRVSHECTNAFGEQFVDLHHEFSGDALAAACDLTIGGGGSLPLRAAFLGKRAVALMIPGVKALHEKETGSAELPYKGAMPEIEIPTDLFSLPMPDPTFLETLTPYTPIIAKEAILGLLHS